MAMGCQRQSNQGAFKSFKPAYLGVTLANARPELARKVNAQVQLRSHDSTRALNRCRV